MGRLSVLASYLGIPREQIAGMTGEQIRQARDDAAADLAALARRREMHTMPSGTKVVTPQRKDPK